MENINTFPNQTPQPVTNYQSKGRLSNSKRLAIESWRILKQDKEILWFPVLSMITSFILLAVIAIIFILAVLGGDFSQLDRLDSISAGTGGVVDFWYLFAYYILSFFIINFFQAGILIIVDARVNGQDLDLQDGINGAFSNFGKIFAWSVISATVGVILNFLANNSKIIGKILSWILGTAWAILTYFSLPSLIIGKKSVKESFKESAQLIKKTWGEAFVVNFGVGLYIFVLTLGVVALGVILCALISIIYIQILIGILVVLFVVAAIIVSSALGVIIKLALYEYAKTGRIIEGLSPDLVQNTISAKKLP